MKCEYRDIVNNDGTYFKFKKYLLLQTPGGAVNLNTGLFLSVHLDEEVEPTYHVDITYYMKKED